MAFVPDDAMDARKRAKLTPAAWYVYEAHCRRRNHRTRRSRAGKQAIASDTGLSLSGVKNATAELRAKGWIREHHDGLELLVGDFTPVDKGQPRPASNEAPPETEGPQMRPAGPEMRPEQPQMRPGGPQMRPPGPEMRPGAYIGTRARLNQPENQPEDQPRTSTHTPAPREGPPDASEPPVPEPRVCVPELMFEDYVGYAEGEPAIRNPRGWAMKTFPKRDPNAEKLVAAWKERRELTLAGRAPAEVQLTPYHVALQRVMSVAQAAGAEGALRDVAAMEDVDEQTRARLRDAVLKASKVAAGRSPP